MYGNTKNVFSAIATSPDWLEHFNTSVVDSVFATNKLKDKHGKPLNVCQKHPTAAESVLWQFADPTARKTTVWEMFGGTGRMSAGLMNLGCSVIYTEVDPIQFKAVVPLFHMAPCARARAVLHEHRVPRAVLAHASMFPRMPLASVPPAFANLVKSIPENPKAMLFAKGFVSSTAQLGKCTVRVFMLFACA